MVDVTVVIPARNAADTIGEQLEAVRSQTTRRIVEVVVVDNGSTDDTPTVVASSPGTRLVDGSTCSGAAAVRNLGARVGAAPVLLFCDADDVVCDGWIDALCDSIEEEQLDVAAGVLRLDGLNDPDLLASRDVRERPRWHGIEYGLGCNLAVTRAAFDALGGFSEDFPGAAGEDVDLFVRAHLQGMRFAVVDGAVVEYRLRRSVRGLLRQQYRYGVANVTLRRRHGNALRLGRSWGGFRQLAKALVRLLGGLIRGDIPTAIRNLGVAAMCCGRIRASFARPSSVARR